MKTNWYNSRAIRIAAHVAYWVIALSLPYLLDTHHGIARHRDDEISRKFFYLNFITNLLWIAPFYINAYIVIPRLLYNRRFVSYAAVVALMFAAVMFGNWLLFEFVFELPHYNLQGATGYLLPPYILTMAVSTAFRVVRDKTIADQRAIEKYEENLKTELAFLRSQINPHFIFNILNNLVALEQMKSPELGPTILKLSSLMQYMLYETDEEKVPLNQEVEYLQSYIDLQKQRFGAKVPVKVDMDLEPCIYEIEPMLLIPFVENAFKHGVGLIQDPCIEIRLRVEDGVLTFLVRNRFNPASAEVKDKTSGIGLGNVSRRLNLLYGASQVLQVRREDATFTVSLKINLH
jgi:hypothetical protein